MPSTGHIWVPSILLNIPCIELLQDIGKYLNYLITIKTVNTIRLLNHMINIEVSKKFNFKALFQKQIKMLFPLPAKKANLYYDIIHKQLVCG